MAQGQNAQTLAYQYEKVVPRISLLFQRDHTLFDKIDKRDNLEVISSRAMRIPLDILAGGKLRQVNPDGGDFGRGSAITADFAQLTSVYFAFATEFSKLMEVATDEKEKAVEPAAKRNLEAAVDQFRAGIEALLNSDGSGTLDTVVSVTSPNVITVNNANQFFDNQDIQVFSALGTASLGTVTIQSVDANAKTLTLTGAYPVGTTTGYLLVVDGAPGVASSSLLGVEYHQVNSTTGTWLQLQRSSYPGKLSTPTVNFASAALTPQKVRLMLSLVRRALGIDTPNVDRLMWQMNLDMEAAWENVGLIVTQVIQNQLGGTESEDMLKKSAPKTMSDRPILCSIHAVPGRIDGLCLDHWGRGETQPIGPLEFGGQILFPVYGNSGGLSAATITYLWTGFNVFTDNPRAGCYGSNIAIPAGY
jgi:hypothetical protein